MGFFWGEGLFLPGGGARVGCLLWGAMMKEGVFVSSILDFGEEESREFASLLLSYTET